MADKKVDEEVTVVAEATTEPTPIGLKPGQFAEKYSEEFGLDAYKIRRMIRAAHIPATKVGARWYLTPEDEEEAYGILLAEKQEAERAAEVAAQVAAENAKAEAEAQTA